MLAANKLPHDIMTDSCGQIAHRTDVHELLGADVVSVEHERLVIVVQELEEPGLILHTRAHSEP
jgi:hypothetical protein